MATLTVTATNLGSYTAKVVNMTAFSGDSYHILHGLGATPHQVFFAMRSNPFASLPMQLVVGSYDATMVYVQSQLSSGTGAVDVVIRRVHSLSL